MKLLAFPYAGGDSFVYRELQKIHPYEVKTLNLPGRGNRFGEPLLHTMKEMATEAIKQFDAELKNEYCIFGHSMGTIIAFELIHTLKPEHQLPKHIFLSGRKSPTISEEQKHRHRLNSKEFRAEVENLGGCPKAVLENHELMDLFEPILKADFECVETYKLNHSLPKLEAPLTLLHGVSDNFSAEEIKKWSELFVFPANYHEFEGGHFFINQNWQNISNIICNSIQN